MHNPYWSMSIGGLFLVRNLAKETILFVEFGEMLAFQIFLSFKTHSVMQGRKQIFSIYPSRFSARAL